MTNSSVFYPMEAFALAMVLYSGGMKEAMLAGIGLILGDVLLHVLQDNFRDKYQRAFSGNPCYSSCPYLLLGHGGASGGWENPAWLWCHGSIAWKTA